jgi:hypothetical protein
MVFVSQRTGSQCPMFGACTGTAIALHIVMSHIEGQSLDHVWTKWESRLGRLRRLRGGAICSADGGPCIDMRLRTRTGGSFESESQFNSFLVPDTGADSIRAYKSLIRGAMRVDRSCSLTGISARGTV